MKSISLLLAVIILSAVQIKLSHAEDIEKETPLLPTDWPAECEGLFTRMTDAGIELAAWGNPATPSFNESLKLFCQGITSQTEKKIIDNRTLFPKIRLVNKEFSTFYYKPSTFENTNPILEFRMLPNSYAHLEKFIDLTIRGIAIQEAIKLSPAIDNNHGFSAVADIYLGDEDWSRPLSRLSERFDFLEENSKYWKNFKGIVNYYRWNGVNIGHAGIRNSYYEIYKQARYLSIENSKHLLETAQSLGPEPSELIEYLNSIGIDNNITNGEREYPFSLNITKKDEALVLRKFSQNILNNTVVKKQLELIGAKSELKIIFRIGDFIFNQKDVLIYPIPETMDLERFYRIIENLAYLAEVQEELQIPINFHWDNYHMPTDDKVKIFIGSLTQIKANLAAIKLKKKSIGKIDLANISDYEVGTSSRIPRLWVGGQGEADLKKVLESIP